MLKTLGKAVRTAFSLLLVALGIGLTDTWFGILSPLANQLNGKVPYLGPVLVSLVQTCGSLFRTVTNPSTWSTAFKQGATVTDSAQTLVTEIGSSTTNMYMMIGLAVIILLYAAYQAKGSLADMIKTPFKWGTSGGTLAFTLVTAATAYFVEGKTVFTMPQALAAAVTGLLIMIVMGWFNIRDDRLEGFFRAIIALVYSMVFATPTLNAMNIHIGNHVAVMKTVEPAFVGITPFAGVAILGIALTIVTFFIFPIKSAKKEEKK